MEASSLSAASVGRQRQKERWWYEGEGGKQSCLEQPGKAETEWEDKIKTSKEERLYIPRILI